MVYCAHLSTLRAFALSRLPFLTSLCGSSIVLMSCFTPLAATRLRSLHSLRRLSVNGSHSLFCLACFAPRAAPSGAKRFAALPLRLLPPRVTYGCLRASALSAPNPGCARSGSSFGRAAYAFSSRIRPLSRAHGC